MPIRVLDAVTISKIAAGEVVERPASVLKELVENALDAGAAHITVEIRAGGTEYMRITDDGCGIPKEQVRLAFENHATSKLREVKDLIAVSTMGFRGEALSSIAAVSRVDMTTRTQGSDAGTRIKLEGGKVLSVEPAGCPDGTTVRVEDIFFNLPARRAFLKRPASEAGACSDTMLRLALGHPAVAFRLTLNGKLAFRTQGDGVLRHAVMSVYDRQTAENMHETDGQIGSLHISGLIGVGSCAKASRSHQHFFVNGRAIRCGILSQALEQACRGRVLIGRFPMCALNIDMPPEAVDVNVHPGKLEVRFRDESGLFTAAGIIMEKAFENENMLTPEKPDEPQKPPAIFIEHTENAGPTPEAAETPAEIPPDDTLGIIRIPLQAPESAVSAPPKPEYAANAAMNAAANPELSGVNKLRAARPAPSGRDIIRGGGGLRMREGTADSLTFAGGAEMSRRIDERRAQVKKRIAESGPCTLMEAAGMAAPAVGRPEWKVIGTAFATYIFVQSGDILYVIDQHAAHERILYEKFMKQWETGIASQVLLAPYTVSVSASEKAQIMENKALLYEVGFDIDDFGDRDIQVRAVPQIMGEPDLTPFFMLSAAELKRLKNAPLAAKRDAVMQAACKHAVKGGDILSPDEINSLIEQMRITGAPPNCPHGRPVIIAVPRTELEKRFSRIV